MPRSLPKFDKWAIAYFNTSSDGDRGNAVTGTDDEHNRAWSCSGVWVNMNMQSVLKTIEPEPDYRWAWANFVPVVLAVAREIDAISLIEIGGGRSPTLTEEQVRDLGCRFTSNDISSKELALGPAWASKANFDIQAQDQPEVEKLAGQFDLSYSKMVMEHVDDYQQAYRNISTLLRPGGVSIAFHPVLFSLPFLVNYLTPESVTKPVVERLYPRRNDNDIP
jgi:2-polyprenyl-3-methyl-5-hydroxy-6-metoxy-1,4-benzoquinol methylase